MPTATTFQFVPSREVTAIKRRLDHPVVDGDGHLIEYMPLVTDLVRDVAGRDVMHAYVEFMQRGLLPDEAGFASARVFWGLPEENTLDRMTVTLPGLTYARLDELGLDFALLYPSSGLTILGAPDAEVRQAAACALNTYYAQMYAEYRDRMEPVAVIPTFTPEEAIAELDHAVGELGLKAVVMSAAIPRPAGTGGSEEAWIDTLGHGSLHDYDPVWRRCRELHVSPAFHGIGYGWGSRRSATNYVYNHLGNFGAAQEAACRSLLLGGVPVRFPDLAFAFLEGGVGWSAQLLADVLGHYEKRNPAAVGAYDPRRFDVDLANRLIDEYAPAAMAERRDRYARIAERLRDTPADHPAGYDDFAQSGLRSEEQILAVFGGQFFFGCEADDPINALAFDDRLLPRAARLNAMFASDIGHWDVRDFRTVLPEAWELVEDGLVDADGFRDFTFGNVTRFLTTANPAFFDGTVVESAARSLAGAH
ncbi:MAG TPA: amidohydrolase family protein [Acidimicrobiia bacterium]|nr:amidohydrolase family protein [Acidimicrobiia bacterium]